MLAATIMVTVPGGAHCLYTIEIQNDGTGTWEVGNYDVRLVVNGEVVKKGKVEGNIRERGAMALVHKAIHAIGGEYEQGE